MTRRQFAPQGGKSLILKARLAPAWRTVLATVFVKAVELTGRLPSSA